VQAYSALLTKLKRDHMEAPHALRAMALLLRDAGAPIASDRYLHEFISVYRVDPGRVAGLILERDTSIDFHGWTRFAHKSELARALKKRSARSNSPRFPASFVLPDDKQALIDFAAQTPGALFIAKPERGTGGQGMQITRDAASLADKTGYVIQRYVDIP
jgi:hypothetical protein